MTSRAVTKAVTKPTASDAASAAVIVWQRLDQAEEAGGGERRQRQVEGELRRHRPAHAGEHAAHDRRGGARHPGVERGDLRQADPQRLAPAHRLDVASPPGAAARCSISQMTTPPTIRAAATACTLNRCSSIQWWTRNPTSRGGQKGEQHLGDQLLRRALRASPGAPGRAGRGDSARTPPGWRRAG